MIKPTAFRQWRDTNETILSDLETVAPSDWTAVSYEAFTADLASDQTARLLQIWSVQKGWSNDRYLVILAVQNKLHPEIFCTNIAVGPGLKRLGITDAELKGLLDDANQFDVRHFGKDAGMVLTQVPDSNHCHPQTIHEFTNEVNHMNVRGLFPQITN